MLLLFTYLFILPTCHHPFLFLLWHVSVTLVSKNSKIKQAHTVDCLGLGPLQSWGNVNGAL